MNGKLETAFEFAEKFGHDRIELNNSLSALQSLSGKKLAALAEVDLSWFMLAIQAANTHIRDAKKFADRLSCTLWKREFVSRIDRAEQALNYYIDEYKKWPVVPKDKAREFFGDFECIDYSNELNLLYNLYFKRDRKVLYFFLINHLLL